MSTTTPITKVHDEDGITLYHGDVLRWLAFEALPGDVMVTDPPYGIKYKSGHFGTLARSIQGDEDASLRDAVLAEWGARPALVFGTWRVAKPADTRMLLIWDTKGALGMGDLSLPWKPSHQEIYVLGGGFAGRRTTDVLCHAPVQAKAANGRLHPHQKPVDLMTALILKCPPGIIVDPFAGSGSTLVAAKKCGRRAIGFELDADYCSIAVRRLAQGVLAL